ncbi:MAG: putative esterase [Paucimonas sp.]|nr:putative esterase [Paucimonas sp.]
MTLAPDLARLLALIHWIRDRQDGATLASRRVAASRRVERTGLSRAYARHCRESGQCASLRDGEAAVVFLHGGGLAYYDVQTFRPLLGYWAHQTGLRILPLAYPSAPEASVVEIVSSLRTSLAALLARSSPHCRLILAGDSIGAYLALQLWHAFQDVPFAGLLLIYPVLDLSGTERQSWQAYGTGYALDATDMREFRGYWREAAHFAPFSLLGETGVSGDKLPPTSVFSAGCDLLHDEAEQWCAGLISRGVPLQYHCFETLAHDFCLMAGAAPSCLEAVNRIGQAMADMAFFQRGMK